MSAVRVKFGEVVSNLNETVRHGEEHSLTRVVGLEHIEPQDPDLRRWDELSDLPDGTSFTRIFRRGQVLFGKRRAYQRKVAVAPFDGICSSDILVFAPANKKLHPDFLLFIVQSEGFFSHALQTSSGSLSPRTRWQDLATFEFELPSIEEQQRIVELLSGVDAHAEALRTQLNVAQETRKSVLYHLLTAGGDGWSETRLGSVFQLSNKKLGSHQSEPEIFAISKYDGVVLAQEYFEQRIASKSLNTYKVISPSDWVYSTIHIDEGSIAVNHFPFEGVVSPMYTTMNWNSEQHDSSFFELLLKSEGAISRYRDNSQGTVNRRRSLSWKTFADLAFLVPPLVEQQRIVDQISKIDNVIQETTSALAATRQLRSALLNKEIS
jgi:type I restriction enzyme S subunit